MARSRLMTLCCFVVFAFAACGGGGSGSGTTLPSSGSTGSGSTGTSSGSGSSGSTSSGSTAPGFVFSQYKVASVGSATWSGQMQSSLNGTALPIASAMPVGNDVLTWAFAAGACGSETWSGVPAQTFVGANIPAFTAAGKKYIVSTGGPGQSFTCASDSDFSTFIATYNSSALLGFDFDLENNQSQADIAALVQRVQKAQQSYPQLRFSFTVTATGGNAATALSQQGQWLVQAIQTAGLANTLLNIKAADYGSAPTATVCTLNTGGACDMAQSAIQAATNVHTQTGLPYSQLELTVMEGVNDDAGEVFGIHDVAPVAAFAKSAGLAGVHLWSFDSDVDCVPGSAGVGKTCNGTQQPLGGNQGLDAATLGYANNFLADLGPAAPTPATIDYSGYAPNTASTPSAPGAATIHFSGIDWMVNSGLSYPGPNHFDASAAWVDAQGFLHLKISQQNGAWTTPQLWSANPVGFGSLQFQVLGYPASLDKNIVLGLYMQSFTTSEEIDIELGTWGGDSILQGHWTVWPNPQSIINTTYQYNPSYSGPASTQRFTRTASSVYYQAMDGIVDPGADSNVKSAWIFAPDNAAARVPQDPLYIGINLWLDNGAAPTDGQSYEIVLRSCDFTAS